MKDSLLRTWFPPDSLTVGLPQRSIDRVSSPHMINWDEIRKQFPVTENSTYLNAAAAGPLSRATMEAATEYYRQMMDDADTHWDEWLAKHGEVISCDLEFPVSTLPWMNRRIPVHLVKSVEGEVRIEDLRGAMNLRTGI